MEETKEKKVKFKPSSKMVKMPTEVKIPQSSSELIVLTKTKDLVKYIFQVSKNSPKKYRQTFINRLQNLGLDIVENMYLANDILIAKDDNQSYQQRLLFQKQANTKLKLLEYFAMLAYESDCILFRHYEQIAKQGAKCAILLGNWISSDKRRMEK